MKESKNLSFYELSEKFYPNGVELEDKYLKNYEIKNQKDLKEVTEFYVKYVNSMSLKDYKEIHERNKGFQKNCTGPMLSLNTVIKTQIREFLFLKKAIDYWGDKLNNETQST